MNVYWFQCKHLHVIMHIQSRLTALSAIGWDVAYRRKDFLRLLIASAVKMYVEYVFVVDFCKNYNTEVFFMKSSIIIRKIVYGAVFTSIAIVIKLFITFETPFFRLSFFEFPLMLCSILLGPLYGALAGFITDLNYIIINPRAMIVALNWFTLESITFGLVPGLFFHYIKYNKKKLMIILLITMILGFTFNTLGINMYYGTGYAVSSIPLRLLRDTLKYPLYLYLIHLFITDSRFSSFNFFYQFSKKHGLKKQNY